jgi:hypothetical protein
MEKTTKLIYSLGKLNFTDFSLNKNKNSTQMTSASATEL